MSELQQLDFQNLVLQLRDNLTGAPLQEVWFANDLLGLKFYAGQGRIHWLELDLNIRSPRIGFGQVRSSTGLREQKKPIPLFLRAHFIGQKLEKVEHVQEYGRVLILHFRPGYEIEIRLFPGGSNAIARTPEKELALRKPLPLKAVDKSTANDVVALIPSRQSSAKLCSDYDGVDRDEQSALKKKRLKLERTVSKVREDLREKQESLWQEAGAWLKANPQIRSCFSSAAEKKKGGLEFVHGGLGSIPSQYLHYFEFDLPWSENLDKCFRKAKEVQAKIVGCEARLTQLEGELRALTEGKAQGGVAPSQAEHVLRPATEHLLAKSDARGRTFVLADGIIFYVGKSAQDNLRILRQAKPWHYWLHLRDRPGCHGILVRNKGQMVAEPQFHLAAHHLIASQLGAKSAMHENEKFDILISECRHVRPIKGDRHGQVTYTHTRILTHKFRMIKFL